MQNGEDGQPRPGARIRRRDRHGRGVRGALVPPGVPLYRTRSQQFDDLVLQAVTRLEPRWESQLAAVEFAVEEIPPAPADGGTAVPLARLDPGAPGGIALGPTGPMGAPGPGVEADLAPARPPRIVVYRRPLVARADGDEELAELVFDVIVEEFARLLGVDPEDIDPGYAPED